MANLMKQFMTSLGAKEGKTSTKRYDWQTEDQKDLFKDTLEGYKNLDYKDPGKFTEGTKADELEGFKAMSFDQLKALKDEGRLSLAGLEKLRSYGATAATQVNPDIEALRGLGDEAWQGYDAHLSDITRGARKKLQAADISSRRGAGTGGTALTRAIGQNIGDYGRTVGEASARVAEESAYRRQQLAMQGRMQAGQLGLAATGQGLQGLQAAGQLELGELGLTAQDLAQRRGIHSQERQYMAQNELGRARYSGERADARNLWNLSSSEAENRFGLDRLRGATTAATTRTFEDVVTKTRGTPGLGGALISAAGTVGGAYLGGMVGNPMLGASIGGSLAGSLVSSSGDYGGDGGSYRSGGYNNMLNAGLKGYYQNQGTTTGGTGGTYNPTVPPQFQRTPTSMGYGGMEGEFGSASAEWLPGYKSSVQGFDVESDPRFYTPRRYPHSGGYNRFMDFYK